MSDGGTLVRERGCVSSFIQARVSVCFAVAGVSLQGEEGMDIAQRLMDKAMLIPGASVHWYGKEGEGF